MRLLPTRPAAVMGRPRVPVSRCVAVPCPFTRLAKKGLRQVPLAAMETPYCVARLSGSYDGKVPSGSKRETDQCHSTRSPSPSNPVLPVAKIGHPGTRDAATGMRDANVRHRRVDQALRRQWISRANLQNFRCWEELSIPRARRWVRSTSSRCWRPIRRFATCATLGRGIKSYNHSVGAALNDDVNDVTPVLDFARVTRAACSNSKPPSQSNGTFP